MKSVPEKPPNSLPPGFIEIWGCLRDEATRQSRQALAQRLGVSTQTLQRILVDGTVPDFRQGTNRRTRNAWIRTLSRLAGFFGREPRLWLERAGISWDAEVETIARTAGGDEEVADTAGRAAIAPDLSEIQVGIASWGVLSKPFRALSESFLHAFSRRLMGAIRPGLDVRLRAMRDDMLFDALRSRDSEIAIGAGLLETVSRKAEGLAFVRLPGIRMHLAALRLEPAGERSAPLDWAGAMHPLERTRIRFLAGERSIAHEHLLAQADAGDRLTLTSSTDPDELGRELMRATEHDPQQRVLLVSDEETCREIAAGLQRLEVLAGRFTIRMLGGSSDPSPAYPLALAVPPRSSQWRDLLAAACDEDLFGANLIHTAGLYADAAAAAFFHSPLVDPLQPRSARLAWRLTEFPAASPDFLRAFYAPLRECLEDGILAHLAGRADLIRSAAHSPGTTPLGPASSDPAPSAPAPTGPASLGTAYVVDLREKAHELAAGHARNLTPAAWHPVLAQIPHPAPARTPYCRSCSTSLAVSHHRGATDRYCRYCSDAEGHLKPRQEVHRILSGWVFHWIGNVSRAEAEARAEQHMAAMPAWSEN